MKAFNVKNIVLVALVAACASFGTGCYAEVQEPVAAYGYQPQYYDGYVVYYDNGGRPYYYNGGSVYWVPAESPYYAGYVNHWRTYGPAYARWHATYGVRYRGWRRR
jgi:hypothetical protein